LVSCSYIAYRPTANFIISGSSETRIFREFSRVRKHCAIWPKQSRLWIISSVFGITGFLELPLLSAKATCG